MSFRHFLDGKTAFSDWQVASIYLGNPNTPLHDIAQTTGKSIGEIYRALERTGNRPNRQITNHHNVFMLADSGLSNEQLALLTGYTPRNVRRILGKRT